MTIPQTQGQDDGTLPAGGMIVRERKPLNLEMPFGSLDGFITPMDRFFVRGHFSIPSIDVKTWRLKIEGEVETPLELTVEISTDGGETWNPTHLLGRSIPNAWRLWEYDWRVPAKAGKVTLMARARDSKGRTQPTERDRDRRSYMVNHLLPIEVDVR